MLKFRMGLLLSKIYSLYSNVCLNLRTLKDYEFSQVDSLLREIGGWFTGVTGICLGAIASLDARESIKMYFMPKTTLSAAMK